VGDEPCAFYITTNLGRSWSIRADPCGGTRQDGERRPRRQRRGSEPVVVECMAKADPNTGFILVSRDGGKSFGPRRPIPQSALMVAAVCAKTIVLASGGRRWRSQYLHRGDLDQ
jgi:hypothetical protein